MTGRHLLVIDPQNDFVDIEGASLPVPGARADLLRIAGLIGALADRLDDITLTLDSHVRDHIANPGFWKNRAGEAPQPFTQIVLDDVIAERYVPANPLDRQWVQYYLDALETAGKYRLMVWPVHCQMGSWGHNIFEPLMQAMNTWQDRYRRSVNVVIKGTNRYTEAYSAYRAEVEIAEDATTQPNRALLQYVERAGLTLIAGEASSHCVRATVTDLVNALPSPEQRARMILLRDGMSPVAGFEGQAEAFLAEMTAAGLQVMKVEQALELV
jgi:nicotinamidase-related amidase